MQARLAMLGRWMVVAMIGACGGSAPPPAQPAPKPMVSQAPPVPVQAAPPAAADHGLFTPRDALAGMARFRDDMCKCTTKPCADTVTDALVRWGEELAKSDQKRDRVTADDTQRMADITEAMTRCMTTAMLGPNGAAAAASPDGSAAAQNVAPTALDANRIAGTKNIIPDDDVKLAFAGTGKSQLVTSYKLCIDIVGDISQVRMLKSSGYPSYDAKIISGMHGWKYSPFRVNGAPAPVCTAVTFIYTQTDPPPPRPHP